MKTEWAEIRAEIRKANSTLDEWIYFIQHGTKMPSYVYGSIFNGIFNEK